MCIYHNGSLSFTDLDLECILALTSIFLSICIVVFLVVVAFHPYFATTQRELPPGLTVDDFVMWNLRGVGMEFEELTEEKEKLIEKYFLSKM